MATHNLAHDGPPASAPNTAPTPARPGGWGRHLLALVPTALVFLLIGAVAAWGVRTEWKFGNPFTAGEPAGPGEEKGEPLGAEVTPAPAGQAGGCPLNGTRIRLTSPDVAGRMGLRVAAVESRPLAVAVAAPAELGYDETRLARRSSRVPGTVVAVAKQIGDSVRQGEVLAVVDAAAVGKAKTDLLEAIAALDLAEKQAASSKFSAEKGAVSGLQAERDAAAARQAQARLAAAQQALGNLGLPVNADDLRKLSPVEQVERLRLLGLSPEYVRTLGPVGASGNLIPVVATLDGVVVERDVVPGAVIDTTKVLFVVADLSRIWVIADVRNEDADRVAVGQRLTFTAAGHTGEALAGPIVWTSTAIDPRTRTLRVRAEIANPGTHWRARTFGTARITLRAAEAPTTVVPPAAVQREGACRYVFVRIDETTFEVRAVRLGVSGEAGGAPGAGGARKEPRVEVLDGVRPGEQVVTTGSFILKAELLKDQLGEAD